MREIPLRERDGVGADVAGGAGGAASPDVPSSLVRALDAVQGAAEKTVGHVGCGEGTLLPVLAARFGRVLGIDDSPAVLARARSRCGARHVTFHRAELADLSAFRARLHVAVTVNAGLVPDEDHLDRVFDSLCSAIQRGGALIGVFPAMEAVLYRGYLIHERERHGAPARTAVGGLEQGRQAVGMGTLREHRGEKFFHAFELRRRLRQAGFRRVRLGRVLHARGEAVAHGGFAGEPPTWDWLVRAET